MELQRVFRQRDPEFVAILNAIREGANHRAVLARGGAQGSGHHFDFDQRSGGPDQPQVAGSALRRGEGFCRDAPRENGVPAGAPARAGGTETEGRRAGNVRSK